MNLKHSIKFGKRLIEVETPQSSVKKRGDRFESNNLREVGWVGVEEPEKA